MRPFLNRLARDNRGAMVVEFALLAPVFLLLVFGVLYAGMGLQSYNAIRNLSADVSRYAVVQQQAGNNVTTTALRSYALSRGQGAPYLLRVNRLNAYITTPTTQRVAGVRELKVQITYEMDNLLGFAGISAPFINYSRPIFLAES